MILTFLGTSAGKPSSNRNVSSLWINLQEEIGENWLVDCGEGTQQQMIKFSLMQEHKKDRINPFNLDRIFITHLHGDHILGLFGLLIARSMAGQKKILYLVGPKGLKKLVDSVLEATQSKLFYNLSIQELDDKPQSDIPLTLLEEPKIVVTTLPLMHRLPCFGYRIDLKSTQKTQSVAIFGDSIPCKNIISLAYKTDYMIFEATYMHDLADLAAERMHSTTVQAAEIASLAQCKHLVITHLSGRYNGDLLSKFQQEVSDVFPSNQIAFDFKQIKLTI